MKILVVDDGQLAINSLIRILCRVAPDCDYISAMTTDDALTWMRQGPMDAAFLNLEMPGMNGLALARMIQKLQPRCNLIVVTEHPEYALEALQIFVSGFLLKPANEADVRNVLENLRYPPETAPVGQTPAQVPQEMQASASITYWLSPWEIALTGHSLSQVPQLTQESEITYAMIISSLNIL